MSALTMQASEVDGVQLSMDLHDGRFGPWIITHVGDQVVRRLMDNHYSRQSKGNPRFCRPGHNIVLKTPDGTGAFISWFGIRDDLQEEVWECTAFHNTPESGYLSSEMIHWAIYATICTWHERFPAKGMITYVDETKILSAHPGLLF